MFRNRESGSDFQPLRCEKVIGSLRDFFGKTIETRSVVLSDRFENTMTGQVLRSRRLMAAT